MTNCIEQTFSRADLQVIRGLLLNGVGDESDIDKRTYKQRVDEDSAPVFRYLESTYPDGEKRDAVFEDISQAITAYQEYILKSA